MPSAAEILQTIGGVLSGVNQQAEANQAKQLQALQLLARQPGTSIVPAQAPQSAGFLSTLLGKPYADTPAAPVVAVGGQPFTVQQAPTLAEAVPELFKADLPELKPLLPILGQVRATEEAKLGAVRLLQQAHGTAETRRVREAQLQANQLEKERLRQRQDKLDIRQNERDIRVDKREEARRTTAFETQKQRAIAELMRVEAFTPEASEAIRAAQTPEELTAAIGTHGKPKPAGVVKPIDMARLRIQAITGLTRSNQDIPADMREAIATAQTPEELSGLLVHGLQPRADTSLQQTRESRIATTARQRQLSGFRAEIRQNQNAIMRAQQGDPLMNIPALSALKDPQEKARREQAIRAYEKNIADAERDMKALEQSLDTEKRSDLPQPVAPAATSVLPAAPAVAPNTFGTPTSTEGPPQITGVRRIR